jgi:hypothetical protein
MLILMMHKKAFMINTSMYDQRIRESATKSEYHVNSRLFLDIVVRDNAVVLESFAGEDKTLLVMRNGLFLFNLVLKLTDGVGGFYVDSDAFSSEVLDKYLHESEGDLINYCFGRVSAPYKALACTF